MVVDDRLHPSFPHAGTPWTVSLGQCDLWSPQTHRARPGQGEASPWAPAGPACLIQEPSLFFFSSSQRTGWFKLLSGGLWPCLFQECQPFLGQISERQAKRGCKLSSTAQPSAASARGAGAVLPLLPSLGTLPLCSSECLLPVRSVPLCIYAAPCKPPSVREPWGFSQH